MAPRRRIRRIRRSRRVSAFQATDKRQWRHWVDQTTPTFPANGGTVAIVEWPGSVNNVQLLKEITISVSMNRNGTSGTQSVMGYFFWYRVPTTVKIGTSNFNPLIDDPKYIWNPMPFAFQAAPPQSVNTWRRHFRFPKIAVGEDQAFGLGLRNLSGSTVSVLASIAALTADHGVGTSGADLSRRLEDLEALLHDFAPGGLAPPEAPVGGSEPSGSEDLSPSGFADGEGEGI